MTAGDEDVLAALEAQLGEVAEPEGARDFTRLGAGQLMAAKEDLTRLLESMGEMPRPLSDLGRARHSELAACVAELKRRRML